MKTFKKIQFTQNKMSHEEMKNVKAGSSSDLYGCGFNSNNYCTANAGVCIEGTNVGFCGVSTVYSGGGGILVGCVCK